MSLVFNMVGGGGGGKLKDTDAVLIVTAPTGSTVTATKGDTTLTPTMWVKAADNTLDCAIFIISASQFDSTTPWTVTGTLGTDSASTTVLITSNKEYEVKLSYRLIIISSTIMTLSELRAGTRITDDAEYSVISQNGDYFVYTASGAANRGWQWKTSVDCTNYNYLVLRGYKNASNAAYFGLAANLSGSTANVTNIVSQSITDTTINDIVVDISALQSAYYVGIRATPTVSIYVESIFLSNTL